MPIITLLTDFGIKDACVGAMKGVILSSAPDARIVDICHNVRAHDIVAAASLLEDSYSFFPPGTIHVAVVDPGVGGDRAAIAIQTERYFFVGPDNGIFGPVLHRESLVEAVRLTNPSYHLPQVSATFHGRDIFAPVAAHLAKGIPLEHLGDDVGTFTRMDYPLPKRDGAKLEAHVLRSDRFGNLITNLKRDAYDVWNPQGMPVRIQLSGGKEILGLRKTYSDVPAQHALAYFGSSGRLEIGVNCGRAEDLFAVASGAPITLLLG